MSGESGVPGGDPRSGAEDGWDWDALLAFIDERRVIPIVGPDLLRIEVDGVSTTFDHYVARQLAGRMSVPAERLPADPSLNDVVSEYVSMGRGARQDLYPKIRNIVREASFPPPRPLVQLAEITDIDLFVTTTFDGLLESALNTARFGGQPMTETIVYKPKGGADLPRPKETLARTAVFHLFGRASTLPDYVISDEDMLEFIFSLQQEKSRPPLLFDAFRDNPLLTSSDAPGSRRDPHTPPRSITQVRRTGKRQAANERENMECRSLSPSWQALAILSQSRIRSSTKGQGLAQGSMNMAFDILCRPGHVGLVDQVISRGVVQRLQSFLGIPLM